MPYINVKTAQKLTSAEKRGMVDGFSKAITLIEGKTADKLMVILEDSADIFFREIEKNSAAFVSVELKDKADLEQKKKLTEAVFAVLKEQAGIANDDVYLNISEFDNWGSRGVLK